MNRGEIRTQIREVSGVEMEALRSDAYIDQVIDDVYAEINDAERWPWLNAEVPTESQVGIAVYPFPGGIKRLRSLVAFYDGIAERGYPLQEVTSRHIYRHESPESGRPTLYARVGTTEVQIDPKPDKKFTLYFSGWSDPPSLLTDLSVPVFDEKYHSAIVYMAVAALLNDEGQFEQASSAFNRAAGFLGRMRENYILSQNDGPLVLNGGGREPVETVGRLWPWRS